MDRLFLDDLRGRTLARAVLYGRFDGQSYTPRVVARSFAVDERTHADIYGMIGPVGDAIRGAKNDHSWGMIPHINVIFVDNCVDHIDYVACRSTRVFTVAIRDRHDIYTILQIIFRNTSIWMITHAACEDNGQ